MGCSPKEGHRYKKKKNGGHALTYILCVVIEEKEHIDIFLLYTGFLLFQPLREAAKKTSKKTNLYIFKSFFKCIYIVHTEKSLTT